MGDEQPSVLDVEDPVVKMCDKIAEEQEHIDEEEEEEEEDIDFDVNLVRGHRKVSQNLLAADLCTINACLSVMQVPQLTPLDAVLLCQDGDASVDVTGNRVWLGARILAQYFAMEYSDNLSSARVLELGAGTGFVGLALALLGASKVTLSDIEPTVLELLQDNVNLNPHTKACTTIRKLAWEMNPTSSCSENDVFDIVIAAECVYDLAVLPMLLSTAANFVDRGNHGHVYMINCTSRLLMTSEAANELFTEEAKKVGLVDAEVIPIPDSLQKAVVRGTQDEQQTKVERGLQQESISFIRLSF